MKKHIALLSLLVISASANAGFQDDNAIPAKQVPAQTVTSVSQVHKARDYAPVSISGNIVSCHDDDDCTFKDKTGTIHIDVEDGAWNGQNITPKQRVRITGRVDIDDDSGHRSIDVYQIDKR